MNRYLSVMCVYVLVLLGMQCAAMATEVLIIRNEKIEEKCDIVRSNNDSKPSLEVTGIGTYVSCKNLLEKGEPFKVTARLSLKLHGTAASLTINGNNVAFDGRDYQMFFEGSDIGVGRLHYLADNPIQSEVPFNLEAVYDGEYLAVKIGSVQVLKERLRLTRDVTISLRPHRAKLKVYDFDIQGKVSGATVAADVLEKSPPCGPYVLAYPINEVASVTYNLPNEAWQASIQIDKDLFRSLTTKYADNMLLVRLPVNDLIQAYQSNGSLFKLKNINIMLSNGDGKKLTRTVLCYDPARPSEFRKATVEMVSGAPSVCIDGKPDGILRGKLDTLHHRYRKQDAIAFSQIGVRESEICVEPRLFDGRNGFQQEAFDDYIEKTCLRIAQNTPDNVISIRWLLYVSNQWAEKHPNELIATDPHIDQFQHPGCLQPSYASEKWRQYNVDIMRKSIEKMRHSPFADRLVIIRVAYGNCGEWNNFGYHEKAFPDFSEPLQKAFVQWLQKKYQTPENLQDAWQNRSVTFDNMHLVPDQKARLGKTTDVCRTYPEDKQVSDYYAFWQEMTVDTIEYYAKLVKTFTDSQLLVGAFYGYYIGHLSNAPYHFQDSGHYAMGRFLKSPYLDFASGPYPYYKRLENACVNGAFSSIALHGKFWYSENDQGTHLSGKSFARYGDARTLDESVALAKRDFMQNLAKGASYYFFDFVLGWYDDPQFMDAVGKLKELDQLALDKGRQSIAQVAVVLDEDVIPRISNNSQSAMIRLRKMLGHDMDSAGAPWDCYLFSDIERIDFSKYKLVIMANSYELNDTKILAIKKYIYNSDRSILYLYSPGLIDESAGYNASQAHQLTGMNFTLAESVKELDFHPAWIASGDDVQVVRRLSNGQAAIASKNFSNYRVYFTSTTGLDAQALHLIYENAGVHCYTEPGVYLFACGDFIGVYSRQGGVKQINLPQQVDSVYDFWEKKVIDTKTNKFTLHMPEKPSCSILYVGR